MARSSECTGSYAHKVLDRDPHCQRRLITTVGGWVVSLFRLSPSAVSLSLHRTPRSQGGPPMQNFQMERSAVLERRQRQSMTVNIVLIILLVLVACKFARE